MSIVKLSLVLAAAAWQDAPPPAPDDLVAAVEIPDVRERGIGSWYGDGRLHGRLTASGEIFDPTAHTCAHRTLPLQTTVLLVNPAAPERRVWCRINDRGPYGAISADGAWTIEGPGAPGVRYRGIIDVSAGAARELGTYGEGRQPIEIRYFTRDTRTRDTVAIVRRRPE